MRPVPPADPGAPVSDEKVLDYLKKVTGDLHRARTRLQQIEAAEHEPIAVVGMGCRFGGGVATPEQLWELLAGGGDAVTEFPTDRGWDTAALADGSATTSGAFVSGATEFDPAFFGISPREATAMDPQQRLVLEVAWESLERARIDPSSLRGSAAGVFLGATSFSYGGDYLGAPDELGGHLITGNVTSMLSGRISYLLGTHGPSMTFDTACSSALVAMHLAARSLRTGECSLALAGGAAIMSTPGVFVEFSRQRGLAPDGRCKSFAAAADGTGWGEGVGIVVLERLADAQRAGHPVLALLRGSAWNCDGPSNGLTAPNGVAQRAVISAALADAGVPAAEVDVVEAHGTGTTLGDPIEAGALLATYGTDRPQERPLWLGSLKSNIAHTQAAAGAGGVIKMVLALQHGMLPATLHVDEPTAEVDWSAGAVQLLTEARKWETNGHPRRAGVSAFGISGTNAHVVIEEPPPVAEPAEPRRQGGILPWVVSGRGNDALAAQADRLRGALDTEPDPVDLAYSLATTRTAFDTRAVVLAEHAAGFRAGLGALAAGREHPDVVTGTALADPRPVFVFPGQGSQWAGMGLDLLDRYPAFAERMAECSAAVAELVGFSPVDVLRGAPGAPPLDRVDVLQPTLFSVMVSLAQVWRAHGVEPVAVLGHSQGEIAAAVVAGALSLDDGVRVCALRARALRALAGHGGMLWLRTDAATAGTLIDRTTDELSLAAVNGPASVVVSGAPDALGRLRVAAEKLGLHSKVVDVDYASHSPQVEQLRAELIRELAGIRPRSTDVAFYSAVFGERIDTARLTGEYWVENLRRPVRFLDAARAALAKRHRLFVESSPHPVLTSAVAEAAELADAPAVVAESLRRDHDGAACLTRSLAEAWVGGAPVAWTGAFTGMQARTVDLPTYPFQRQRYWYTPPRTASSPAETRFWEAVERTDGPAVTAALGTDVPAEVLTGLSAWRRSLQESLPTAYTVAWRPTAITEPVDGSWLVVAPSGDPMGPALADALAPARLLTADELAGEPAPAGIAVLGDVEHAVAAMRAGVDAPLWCVTRGAVATDPSEPADPEQAAVWGLAGSFAAEFPARRGGLIDLTNPDSLELVAAALRSAAPGEQLAVRDGAVRARRLVPTPRGASRHSWTADGTVLVTGGLGGIGRHLAPWLADRGARHLLLLGRRGPDTPGAAALRTDLEARGVGVDIVACDATDRAALAAALTRVPAEHPLRAVVHLAAELDDAPLTELTPGRITAAACAKADTARHLDELTADADLTAFVLFSAVAGTVGVAGQAGYAAANAAVDALARDRRARGLPGTSVAWGAWADSGMVDDATAALLAERGVRSLAPAEAIAALQRALDADTTCTVVADVDWELFLGSGAVVDGPLLDELPEVTAIRRAAPAAADEAEQLRTRLTAVDRVTGLRLLQELVSSRAAEVLGYDGAAAVPATRPFKDVGVDSLTAVQLRNRLGRATGLALPVTLAFDHPDPAAVAEFLHGELAVEEEQEGGLGAQLDRLEALLAEAPVEGRGREAVTARLRTLLWRWEAGDTGIGDADLDETASDEEMFELLDRELGMSAGEEGVR